MPKAFEALLSKAEQVFASTERLFATGPTTLLDIVDLKVIPTEWTLDSTGCEVWLGRLEKSEWGVSQGVASKLFGNLCWINLWAPGEAISHRSAARDL